MLRLQNIVLPSFREHYIVVQFAENHQFLGDRALHAPYRGFAPRPHWGLPSPSLPCLFPNHGRSLQITSCIIYLRQNPQTNTRVYVFSSLVTIDIDLTDLPGTKFATETNISSMSIIIRKVCFQLCQINSLTSPCSFQ